MVPKSFQIIVKIESKTNGKILYKEYFSHIDFLWAFIIDINKVELSKDN